MPRGPSTAKDVFDSFVLDAQQTLTLPAPGRLNRLLQTVAARAQREVLDVIDADRVRQREQDGGGGGGAGSGGAGSGGGGGSAALRRGSAAGSSALASVALDVRASPAR